MTDCFRYDGNEGLLITDGVNWTPVAETRYHHKNSRLANYKVSFQLTQPPTQPPTLFQGKPFIVGSRGYNDNKHTEVLENGAWTKLRDYPYGSYVQGGISAYATASTPTAAYIIGGYEHTIGSGLALKTIAKYENDAWANVGGPTGGLGGKRYGHNAIWLDDELFVVGGHQTR